MVGIAEEINHTKYWFDAHHIGSVTLSIHRRLHFPFCYKADLRTEISVL